MAFDFPASPTLDQTYTAHGVTYKWNGTAWIMQGGGGGAPLDSPAFTGNPTAPTPAANDNDTSIATTAYVQGELADMAPLASPTFTGDPKAPTPATADNDTSIATTAFVKAQGYAPIASPTFTGDPKAPTPATADNDTSIATTAFVKAQGYLLSADLSGYALLASPTFTGDPKAPTPATADNDTSIATTAFVKAQGYATTASLSSYAPLASPALTGNPTAPTPGAGDNDTSVATTAFVQGELAGKVAKTGDTMSGPLSTALNRGYGLPNGDMNASFLATPAATKSYGADANSEANNPGGAWWFHENFRHSNSTNHWGVQVAWGWEDNANQLWTRNVQSGTFGGWVKYLNSVNFQDYAAPIASPAFTGNPTAPTPGAGDNDTSIATTAFVQGELAGKLSKSGGVMTGQMSLYGDCTWQFAGAGAGAWYASSTTPNRFFVGTDTLDNWRIYSSAISADLFDANAATGLITVYGDPTSALGIATKQYVDNKATLSSSVPAGLGAGAPGAATTISRSDHVHPSYFRDYAASGVATASDLNTLILQGLYEVNSPVNGPSDLGDGWCLVETHRHSNSGNQYLVQFLTTMTAQPVKFYMRSCVGNAPGTWTAWQRITDSNQVGIWSDYLSAQAKLIPADQIWSAGGFSILTDGATVTPDFSIAINFSWALAAAGRTLANPTNSKIGQSGIIAINAGASGTITGWGTMWKFAGGIKPVLTPSSADLLCYTVRNSSIIYCTFVPDVR